MNFVRYCYYIMEVPGQRVSKDKYEKRCSFCEDFDITTNADGFCVECEVYFCNACFVKHKGRKISRNHSLVIVDESNSVEVTVGDTYETCQEHTGEIVKYYCPKHDQVGCGECIIVCHNGCKLELIRNKAADYDNSYEFRNLREEMNKYIKEAEDSLSLVDINKQQLADSYEQFVRDVEAFTDKVIERINIMRQTVLNQAKDIMLNDKRKIEDLQKETDELIAELTRQNNLLESKRNTPNKLFVSCLLIKPELKRTQDNLDCLRTKNVVIQYEFMQDNILAESITESKAIGMLIKLSSERSKQQQHEFMQTYLADEGQVRDPSPQHDRRESRYNQTEKEATEACTRADTMKAMAPQKHQQHILGKKSFNGDFLDLSLRSPNAMNSKAKPLLDRKLVCKNIKVDGECLSYTANESNGVGLFVLKHIARYGQFIEIEILRMGKSGSLAIGVVPDNYPDNLLPGEGKNSCGYHSDANVYLHGRTCDIMNRQSSQVGDKIRCTIDYNIYFDRRVMFEHNGKKFGHYILSSEIYHFAVGLTSPGDQVEITSLPEKYLLKHSS